MKKYCSMCQHMIEERHLVDDGHGNTLCPRCWAWVKDEKEADKTAIEPADAMGEAKQGRSDNSERAEKDAEMDYIDQLGGVV